MSFFIVLLFYDALYFELNLTNSILLGKNNCGTCSKSSEYHTNLVMGKKKLV